MWPRGRWRGQWRRGGWGGGGGGGGGGGRGGGGANPGIPRVDGVRPRRWIGGSGVFFIIFLVLGPGMTSRCSPGFARRGSCPARPPSPVRPLRHSAWWPSAGGRPPARRPPARRPPARRPPARPLPPPRTRPASTSTASGAPWCAPRIYRGASSRGGVRRGRGPRRRWAAFASFLRRDLPLGTVPVPPLSPF